MEKTLVNPLKEILYKKKLKYIETKYGNYKSDDYKSWLLKSKAMIFLSEHESQGIAYQEALSSGVPIFAWDQGKLIDENYKIWGDEHMATSSVPYFDERCGIKFKNIDEFVSKFDLFLEKVDENFFKPREYILENLTLEKSAKLFLEILDSVK